MIAVISPAKSLDFETQPKIKTYSHPEFLSDAEKINAHLKKLKGTDLIKLMGISAKLAALNVDRNLAWHTPFTPENSKQAIFAFNGDVYDGLNTDTFSENDFTIAQEKIRILSGLYGILKPLDLIQPYRLEMGTKLRVAQYKDLYFYWNKKITTTLNDEINEKGGILINLASQEYFKVIDNKKITGRIITPEFKDSKNGSYKIISFYAKKARGLMSRFIIQNDISNPEDLKSFDLEGYYFNNHLTQGDKWVFTRDN